MQESYNCPIAHFLADDKCGCEWELSAKNINGIAGGFVKRSLLALPYNGEIYGIFRHYRTYFRRPALFHP